MAERAFQVALIGCGAFGLQHASAIQNVPDVNLAMVHDHDQDRAESFARQFSSTPIPSFGDIAADGGIDAVILATPTDTHFALAGTAIDAGKHVLVEKPVTLELSQLDQLIERSRETGVQLLAAQSLRFEPTLRALWETVQRGEVGAPVLFNWISNSSRAWPDGWRAWQADVRRSGGMPFHLGIHGIDLAIWLMNSQPERVYAQGADIAAPGTQLYDYHHVSIRFANGANALIEYYVSLPGRTNRYQELRLYGTEGQTQWRQHDDGLLIDASGGRPFTSEAAESIRLEIAQFVACCQGLQEPLITADQMRWGVATAIASRRSLVDGQAVSVSQVLEEGLSK